MTNKAVLVAITMCGCLISPVIPLGSGKSRTEAQHDSLEREKPTHLATAGKWAGPIRTAKIRVWADDDYRAQNIHWEQAFAKQLDAVNEVLGPSVGLHLDAEYRSWSRHAPGVTLSDDVDALAKQDPGTDVLSVVGLTSSLSLVTATFEQLGEGQEGAVQRRRPRPRSRKGRRPAEVLGRRERWPLISARAGAPDRCTSVARRAGWCHAA